MNKKAVWILLIVCLVLTLAFGGCARPETSVPPPTSTLPSPPQEKPEIEVKPQTIAILIDENTYRQVRTEIERYAMDIKNDLQANVFLFHQNWQSPREVKNQLLSLKDKNLKGAVLIGEIPVPYFESTLCIIGDFPSDRYYMDLEDAFFTDEDNDGKFELTNYSVNENLMRIIWVGRIKPYRGGAEGITLLKNYFERNHQYRTGKISPTKRLLVYSPDIQNGPCGATLEIYLNNMRDFLTLHRSSDILYSWDEIDILVGSSRQEYLEALQKNYEILELNAHGTQFAQILGDGPISSEDVKVAQPKPYFYFLYSCANGDFTQENYIGGHYLFDGNGLVVYTPVTSSMAGAGEMRKYIAPLALGLTFGEAAVSFGTQGITSFGLLEVILGDPTLRIRPKTGIPRIEVDTTKIDFGEVVAGKEQEYYGDIAEKITIKNTGTGKLISNVDSFYFWTEKEGKVVRGDSWASHYDKPILPGESSEIKYSFWPREKGDYTGYGIIKTNDPDNSFIVIELRGRGK